MKIVFAPSGKRMIPYPPCGPAVLEAAVSDHTQVSVRDLEMLVWEAHDKGESIPIYDGGSLDPWQMLKAELPDSTRSYQQMLVELSQVQAGEPLGISVMGYEQLASALLLMRAGLEAGSRVIMGGQFFSSASAEQLLKTVRSEHLTVTVGDGFNAIREWLRASADHVPENSYRWTEEIIVEGLRPDGVMEPPLPHYASVDWKLYERYAGKVFRDQRPVRRAHIYVWDKTCPFRCTFCRVSSGSEAKLSKPAQVAALYENMLQRGATQFNFMTNELNPSSKYLKQVLDAMEAIDVDYSTAAWFTYLRPDPIDADDFRRLRRVGCRLVRYGVETGSQRLSDRMRKDYKIPVIAQVLRDAAAADIFNHVNLLVGFPGETEEDVQETFKFLADNKQFIHSIRINPFYLPPGSPMARSPQDNNIKLIRFNKGFWEFEVSDGVKATAEVVKQRITRIVEWCTSNGVGFAATLPFETINILSMFDSRDEGMDHMRAEYPFFWRVANSDGLKAHFGGYARKEALWEDTIYKRGRNYNMVLCND